MSELKDKVIVITGAAGGIGSQVALLSANAGAKLVLVDRDENALKTVLLSCEAAGAAVRSVTADVTRSGDVKGYVDAAVDSFGTIDGFFNNAGIEGAIGTIVDCSEEDFDRVIAVNLRGVFLGLKFVLPVMIAKGSGSIVNTGSLASERGLPATPAYIAAKHGVLGLTRAATAEVAKFGVRVNAVLPGMVDTRLLRSIVGKLFDGDVEAGLKVTGSASPMGRNAKPEEIAQVVTFLMSDRASFVNGVAWPVDGGVLATIGAGG